MATQTCTRCKRERDEKYVFLKKNYSGKRVWRCHARSVCSSIARRNNARLASQKVAK